MSDTPARFTEAEFVRLVIAGDVDIRVRPPYKLLACTCGDTNCHGWRIVTGSTWVSEKVRRMPTSIRRAARLALVQTTGERSRARRR